MSNTEQLTTEDLSVILESLEYSKRNSRDAQGTLPEVRMENFDRIEAVVIKLRKKKTELPQSSSSYKV